VTYGLTFLLSNVESERQIDREIRRTRRFAGAVPECLIDESVNTSNGYLPITAYIDVDKGRGLLPTPYLREGRTFVVIDTSSIGYRQRLPPRER
jgi:hypothetical protein